MSGLSLRVVRSVTALGAGLALAGAAVSFSLAQEAIPAPVPDAAAYRALANLPDWSGAWSADPMPAALETNAALPLAPKYAVVLSQLRAKAKAGEKPKRDRFCRPLGMPLSMSHTGPLQEILYAPGHVFFNSEAQETRDIHTDGRKLPDEVQIDGFAGFSVGHWEGGTLVVETMGLLDDTDLVPGLQNGGNLHISERIRLIGPDKLEDQITLSGAKALTKPYTYTTTFTRHREWAVAEYVCLTDSHAIYKVEGYKPTQAQLFASTNRKPPVRIAAPAPAAKPTSADWEAMAKLPEWSGWWAFDNARNEAVSGEFIPLTPRYQDYMKVLYKIRDVGGDSPSDVYHCRPRGAPQMMKAAGAGFFVVYTPGKVTMDPNNSQVRRFYTDGRPHPKNVELSFNGHSTAKWEGDTLIADTVGMRPDIQMFYGMPAGDNLHMVERIHTIGPDKMEVVTTQDSKVALTQAWTYKRTFTRHRDWALLEDYCAQNNRDVSVDTGMQTFDLTPPPELNDTGK